MLSWAFKVRTKETRKTKNSKTTQIRDPSVTLALQSGEEPEFLKYFVDRRTQAVHPTCSTQQSSGHDHRKNAAVEQWRN